MNLKKLPFVFFVILPTLLIAASATAAHAYSMTGQPQSITPDITGEPSINLNWNNVLNNLSSPFQNFSQSLQSAAKTPIENFNFNTSSVAVPENVLSRFDAWFFSIAGFHMLVWMLGAIKWAIDGLFSLLRLL